MEVRIVPSPFGSVTRTRVLLALELLSESHARELARLLGHPLSSVQKALRSLEGDGLVSVRDVGRTRVYRMDPRAFAGRELRAYLRRLAETDSALVAGASSLRRRPRRTGKPL